MSSPSQTAAPSSIFKSMLDTALAEYQTKTGDDLLAHWLAAELQTCESVDSVLDILRDQAKTFEQSGDQKLMKWIDPVVHVLYTFSGALGDGVSLVPTFHPAKVLFTGIGALLAAAKAVRASHAAIIELFERIESLFKRLEVYTGISLSTKMAEVLVKIVIELLSILSIATKEVKRRRAKIYFRKLLGRTDIEDALKKLDTLIKEELQMVTAQILKVTTEAKDDAGKANMVMQQDMEEVKRDVLEVKRDVEEVKWTQIEKEIHKWLSPPDPSTNYNMGCETHQEGTAAWFFQSKKFQDWTSNGSLLWIHGKPGSGKSILCSAIIKYVMSLRDAGQAALAFFYFDFRDKDKKQDFRNFIASLLVQLSAHSTFCCEIIFRIYSTHGKGTRQPSNGTLTDCLREMLSIAAEQPMYIIVDALDECPNASGMPTPREVVLDLLESFVRPGLPNLHICVTSRPEIDIKNVLRPLASAVSLHDEIGQKKDISDYVSNIVHADRKMRTWRDEDRKLVVGELSDKADGMFRWVFCQLEVLRHCFPANIRQTLRELPESLDETYARVLKDINKTNQGHAHRMLQCLMVAVRPLLVEELAELLAFEFDGSQGGIPKYRAAWRLDDQTQAVLSTCSSLITIVSYRWPDRQVVQFSHFSVKEFLMSGRLTSALGDFSHYHIRPGSAHTILTQACLGSLLHLGDDIDEKSVKMFPLVEYAAEHWVEHAQFEDVAPRVKDGMETLFDSDKPYFAVWIGIYDIDYNNWGAASPNANPLYYATLCGFYDLVKHLAVKHPQYVNAAYGLREFPLLAALSEDHAEIAELLLDHGADINVRGSTGKTLLLLVLSQPQFQWKIHLVDVVKFLLEHGAKVNVQDKDNQTPLNLAIWRSQSQLARILLEHGADANAEDNNGKAPLHILSDCRLRGEGDVLELAPLLLKFGAKVNRRDNANQTLLHLAIGRYQSQLARILLEHGADVNVEDNDGKTPLHRLLERCFGVEVEGDVLDLAPLLLKFGAEVNRRDKENQTLLHLVIRWGQSQLARILLKHGADPNAEDNNGKTPLHILSESCFRGKSDVLDLAPLLLKLGAKVNRGDMQSQTPLHLAIERGQSQLARILLENDADANAEDNNGKTPLHTLSECWIRGEGDVLDLVPRLSKLGAEVNRRDKENQTPLHLAIRWGQPQLAQILLEHDADANAEDNNGETLLHILSECWIVSEGDVLDLAQLLLKLGAEVNRCNKENQTPLHLAVGRDRPQLTRILLENGADPNAKDSNDKTPWCILLENRVHGGRNFVNHARLLLEEGVGVNRRDGDNNIPLLLEIDPTTENKIGETSVQQVSRGKYSSRGYGVGVTQRPLDNVDPNVQDQMTPSHLQSNLDQFQIAMLLIYHGANPDAGKNEGETPLYQEIEGVNVQNKNRLTSLHVASLYGWAGTVQILLDRGAAANSADALGWTPLHFVAGSECSSWLDVRIARLLLEHGADVNARDKDNTTPLHVASYFGRVDVVQVLLDHGANADLEKNPGLTPLHLVAESRYCFTQNGIRIAKLLLEHGCNGFVEVDAC